MTGAFNKSSRLTRGAEFSHVFARPQVVQDRCFRILARSSGRDGARLGLAVSKKICKSAVGRNRLKRVIRESFRHHAADRHGIGALDIVVLPRHPAATICNRELYASLTRLWRRLMESGPRSAGEEG